jgi:hypothetical protein
MPATSSGRWLAGITVGVIALAVIAVVVTLTASSRNPDALPLGSPEARVQEFILAIDDGKLDLAYGMLASAVADECRPSQFRGHLAQGQRSNLRVQLDDVSFYAEQADVTVSVSSFSGEPPFDFSENKHQARFTLSQGSMDWAIVEAPWPFSGCPFFQLDTKRTLTPTSTPQPHSSPNAS